jgi:hypothetical protein
MPILERVGVGQEITVIELKEIHKWVSILIHSLKEILQLKLILVFSLVKT